MYIHGASKHTSDQGEGACLVTRKTCYQAGTCEPQMSYDVSYVAEESPLPSAGVMRSVCERQHLCLRFLAHTRVTFRTPAESTTFKVSVKQRGCAQIESCRVTEAVNGAETCLHSRHSPGDLYKSYGSTVWSAVTRGKVSSRSGG